MSGLAPPPALPEMMCLTPMERRMVALVQPFARVFHTSAGADGMHGPVKFVPLEPSRFKEGVYENLIRRQRILLGRVFRHPNALRSYYSNMVSSQRYVNLLVDQYLIVCSFQSQCCFKDFGRAASVLQGVLE